VGGSALQSVFARVNRPAVAAGDSGEAGLVVAARGGDERAYARLLQRHQDVAFRAAYLVCGSHAEAEDAMQEACLKAWLALDRFRAGESFRPWLVRIVINEARNRRRSAGRRAGLALRLAPTAGNASVAASAQTEAIAGQERARLLAAVAALREEDQLVIAARYFLGLGEAETASALGLRRGTVKSRLSRALERLRRQLEQDGGG
jgi:RNA polymerase sigma factor (sigma-70 family)